VAVKKAAVKKKAKKAMTTEAAAPAKRRRRKPRSYPTIVASFAVFAVVLVLLGTRVAAGHDPVLGAVHIRIPRPEIVRRIVRKVIVETTVATHAPGKQGTTVSSSPVTSVQSSGAEPAPALVTRSS